MGFLSFLIGSLAGAGLMYMLDPTKGGRRRALLRDQMVKLLNTTSDRVEVMAEDAANRARGTVAETARQFSPDGVTDETLVARVRSEMGRYVSHPRAIEVTAEGGIVTLTGDILAQEVQPFVSAVKSVPGVRRVVNQLQQHDEAGSNPNLQGGKTRAELH